MAERGCRKEEDALHSPGPQVQNAALTSGFPAHTLLEEPSWDKAGAGEPEALGAALSFCRGETEAREVRCLTGAPQPGRGPVFMLPTVD